MPRLLLLSAYGCLQIYVTVALTVVWCSRSTCPVACLTCPLRFLQPFTLSMPTAAVIFNSFLPPSVHPCLFPCTYFLITIILPLLVNVTQTATQVTLLSYSSLPTSNRLLCLTFYAFWTLQHILNLYSCQEYYRLLLIFPLLVFPNLNHA